MAFCRLFLMNFYDCKGIMIHKCWQYSILGKCPVWGFIPIFRYFVARNLTGAVKIPICNDCPFRGFFVILHMLYK